MVDDGDESNFALVVYLGSETNSSELGLGQVPSYHDREFREVQQPVNGAWCEELV